MIEIVIVQHTRRAASCSPIVTRHANLVSRKRVVAATAFVVSLALIMLSRFRADARKICTFSNVDASWLICTCKSVREEAARYSLSSRHQSTHQQTAHLLDQLCVQEFAVLEQRVQLIMAVSS